jgi:LPXTG-motif cell wall-anchored protein
MIKKITTQFCINIFVILLFFSLTLINTLAATTNPKIDIATSPVKELFDLANLKPGDWAERTLTIQNKGKQDFKYLSSSKLKDGSEKFYNELLLKISDKNNVLFDGKMKDFTKLDSRLIAKNDSEQLFFKVVVPDGLGNEFQGLGCKVEFKFYVEGTLGGVLPVDGPKLPETGTSMFNFMVSGTVLLISGSILQLFIYRRKKLFSRN